MVVQNCLYVCTFIFLKSISNSVHAWTTDALLGRFSSPVTCNLCSLWETLVTTVIPLHYLWTSNLYKRWMLPKYMYVFFSWKGFIPSTLGKSYGPKTAFCPYLVMTWNSPLTYGSQFFRNDGHSPNAYAARAFYRQNPYTDQFIYISFRLFLRVWHKLHIESTSRWRHPIKASILNSTKSLLLSTAFQNLIRKSFWNTHRPCNTFNSRMMYPCLGKHLNISGKVEHTFQCRCSHI